MCSSDQGGKKNQIQFCSPLGGEKRSSDHESYNPSGRCILPQSVCQCMPVQPRCEQHLVPSSKVRPQETPVLALLVCASKPRVCACMGLPLQGRIIPNPLGESSSSGRLCKVPMFITCSPLGVRLHAQVRWPCPREAQ